VEAALAAGLLVNRTSETVVRLLPPYIVSPAEIAEGVALLERAIASVEEAQS
jgi:acetylornithine aminotransferase/acetylornithine/N-succinyldiaminopimelate aminotransferase